MLHWDLVHTMRKLAYMRTESKAYLPHEEGQTHSPLWRVADLASEDVVGLAGLR